MVNSELNADDKEAKILIGSCGGVVVISAEELQSYYDGYRTVAIIALVAAIPILWLWGC